MRINDVKQILWWLAAGLLICAGALVVILIVKPSRSLWGKYSKWGELQTAHAASVAGHKASTSQDFQRSFGATFTTRIDGIEPEKPPPPPPPAEEVKEPDPEEFQPLADFMDVAAIWTDVVFFRPKGKSLELPPDDVRVGDAVPGEKLPGFRGEAKLLRIEAGESPFRAVFLANGNEEIFLVPQPAVILEPAPASRVATFEEYKGPGGLVQPVVRQVGPVGVSRAKDDSVVIGPDIQALIRSDSEGFLKDVAWDVHEKGVAISKIRPGSRIDLLNKELGGGILRDGDVIQTVNGVKVESKAQIINHFRRNPVKPGSRIVVEIFRAREGRTVSQSFSAPATQ